MQSLKNRKKQSPGILHVLCPHMNVFNRKSVWNTQKHKCQTLALEPKLNDYQSWPAANIQHMYCLLLIPECSAGIVADFLL